LQIILAKNINVKFFKDIKEKTTRQRVVGEDGKILTLESIYDSIRWWVSPD
jgi:hypothetical protein